MTGNQCRTDRCTRPAAADRATCHTCRERNRPPKVHVPEQEVIDAAIRDRQPVRALCRRDAQFVSRRLTALGVPATEIGRVVGRTPRTISRWRAADRAANSFTHAELVDLDGQGVGPVALHTSTTVPTGSYL
ncbi:hypothetical protein ACGFW5_30995 [Streptomyces sp. NPDC048416]|uniref:hypothetical protein n=1 Tax=Streptomyces sp. NPDC048416 TaxID=3365546 RepID=UPI0037163317